MSSKALRLFATAGPFFWAFLKKHKKAEIWGDCIFPVETNFLSAIAVVDLENREFEMPYPLYDISTVVDIKIDRINSYSGSQVLRKHHPVDDCKASFDALQKRWKL